jgi:endonuclease/exonuclease/phosphatase family metal-dependent hydrolase
MSSRSRLTVGAAVLGLLLSGLTVAVAETAPSAGAARCKGAVVPKPKTATQTSTSQAQVRWAAGKNVKKYRLHWSPAPFGQWPGYAPTTPWTRASARVAAVNLPSVHTGDKFMNVAYGNPIFAQLQVSNGCNKSVRQSAYVPVWPRAKDPGNASTGDALAVGSYNLELYPTNESKPTKMANIASNISSHGLNVALLQEATFTTATQLVARLGSSVWKVVTIGRTSGINQQIIYRSDRFTEAASGKFGQADDHNAATPLPTPWARLQPTSSTGSHRGLFVVSVHLEESPSKSVPTKKAAAHNAAAALLRSIAATNTQALPVIVAGDFKGNFNTYCDEKSRPVCVGEGQPTFIRAGYYDAQAALKKTGVAYATVNKHAANQLANKSGFGGRADYILLKGFPGSYSYEVVRRSGSAAAWPDHNMIVAHLFVPHL